MGGDGGRLTVVRANVRGEEGEKVETRGCLSRKGVSAIEKAIGLALSRRAKRGKARARGKRGIVENFRERKVTTYASA